MFAEAFLLGLSSGTYCIMACAPVVLPFLFSESLSNKQNMRNVLLFMLGRFAGYLAFGAVLGAAGALSLGYLDPEMQRNCAAIGYIVIGLLLLATGLMYNFSKLRLCNIFKKIYRPEGGALLFGLLTGLNFCPPFFAAAMRAFGSGQAIGGVLYFFAFFLGTSVFFVPLFGVQLIKKISGMIQMVARMVLLLMGFYFVFVLGILSTH
jgi:sulfite exporter TauE/SafE